MNASIDSLWSGDWHKQVCSYVLELNPTEDAIGENKTICLETYIDGLKKLEFKFNVDVFAHSDFMTYDGAMYELPDDINPNLFIT